MDADLLPLKVYIHRLVPVSNSRFMMVCRSCGAEFTKERVYYRHTDALHRCWETGEGLLYYE